MNKKILKIKMDFRLVKIFYFGNNANKIVSVKVFSDEQLYLSLTIMAAKTLTGQIVKVFSNGIFNLI